MQMYKMARSNAKPFQSAGENMKSFFKYVKMSSRIFCFAEMTNFFKAQITDPVITL